MEFLGRGFDAAKRMRADRRGGLPMQVAMAMSAAGVLGALFAAPMLDTTTGVDKSLTGSLARQPQRYIIRQSVLSNGPEVICISGGKNGCRD